MPGPVILELHAHELKRSAATLPLRTSPVLAVVDAGELHVGEAAACLPDLDPRRRCDRYVSALASVVPALPGLEHLSAADLLYRHLQSLADAGAAERLVLAPCIDAEQLPLLIGICTRAGHRPQTLIDAAVLAGIAGLERAEQGLYIDIGVDTVALASLRGNDEGVARTACTHIEGPGVASARQLWLRSARELGIAQWRRDPLLDPQLRSAIAAAWPEVCAGIADGRDGTLELAGESLRWSGPRLALALRTLLRAVQDRALLESSGETVMLLPAASVAWPGFAEALARDRHVRVLSIDALVQAASGLDTHVLPEANDAGLAHVLQLPWQRLERRWRTVAAPALEPARLLLACGNAAFTLARDCPIALSVLGDRLAPPRRMGVDEPVADGTAALRQQGDHVRLDAHDALPLRLNGASCRAPLLLRPGDTLKIGLASLQLYELQHDGA